MLTTLSILARGCMSRGPVSGPQVLTPLPGVVKALASPSWLGYLVPTSMRAVATAAITAVEAVPVQVAIGDANMIAAEVAELKAKLKYEKKARDKALEEANSWMIEVKKNPSQAQALQSYYVACNDTARDHSARILSLEAQIATLQGVLSGLSTRAKLTLESFMSFVKAKSLNLRDDRRSVPKATFGFDLLDRITERQGAFFGILSCLELYHRRLANGGTRAPIPIVCGGPGSGKSLIINCVAFRGVFKGTEVTEFTRALSQMTPEFRGWYESLLPVTVTFNDDSSLTAGEKHPHQSLVTRLLWSYFIESEAPFSKFRQHFEEEFHEVSLESVLTVIEADSSKKRSDILVVVDELAKLNRRFTDRYNDQSAAELVMHELSSSTVPLVWSSLDVAGVSVMKTASDRPLHMVMAAGLSKAAMQNFVPDLRDYFGVDENTARIVAQFIGGVPRVLVTALTSNLSGLADVDDRNAPALVQLIARSYSGGVAAMRNSADATSAAIVAFATTEQLKVPNETIDSLLASGLLINQGLRHDSEVTLPLFYAYCMSWGRLAHLQEIGSAAHSLALCGFNPREKDFEKVWFRLMRLSFNVEHVLHGNRGWWSDLLQPISFRGLLRLSSSEVQDSNEALAAKLKPLEEELKPVKFESTSLPSTLLQNRYYYCPTDKAFPGFDHLLTRESLDGKIHFMAMECKSGIHVSSTECARKIALTLGRHPSLHQAILEGRFVFAMVVSAQGYVPPSLQDIQNELVKHLEATTSTTKTGSKDTQAVVSSLLDAFGTKNGIHGGTVEAVAPRLVEQIFVFVTREEIRKMAGPSLSAAFDNVFENSKEEAEGAEGG